MDSPAAPSATGLLLAVGLATTVLAQPASPQAPMEVTTDTPEYCIQLLDRVHSMVQLAIAKPPHEVSFLSSEGQKMCAQGQTRGGIMRLRQAIMLMMHDEEPTAK